MKWKIKKVKRKNRQKCSKTEIKNKVREKIYQKSVQIYQVTKWRPHYETEFFITKNIEQITGIVCSYQGTFDIPLIYRCGFRVVLISHFHKQRALCILCIYSYSTRKYVHRTIRFILGKYQHVFEIHLQYCKSISEPTFLGAWKGIQIHWNTPFLDETSKIAMNGVGGFIFFAPFKYSSVCTKAEFHWLPYARCSSKFSLFTKAASTRSLSKCRAQTSVWLRSSPTVSPASKNGTVKLRLSQFSTILKSTN